MYEGRDSSEQLMPGVLVLGEKRVEGEKVKEIVVYRQHQRNGGDIQQGHKASQPCGLQKETLNIVRVCSQLQLQGIWVS